MDSIVREEFEDRQSDIDSFIDLVKFLDNCEGGTIFKEESNDLEYFSVNDSLVDVLKSVIYLLSYNQVESTLRGCVEGVYDHIDDNNVGYDQLRSSIQNEVLKAFKKSKISNQNLQNQLGSNLSLSLPKTTLDIRGIFNGNISQSKVVGIKNAYGLEISAPVEARDGTDLTTLKDARNDLAHGNDSFSDYGSRNSLADCVNISDRTSIYLNSTISAFDSYLVEEGYLP